MAERARPGRPVSAPGKGSATHERDLVTELAALVVARVSPEEMVIFDELAEEYFRDPARAVQQRRRDEALGFGLDLALVVPYALTVAGTVVHFLGSVAMDLLQDAAKDSAEPAVRDLVRRMFVRVTGRPARPAEPVVALNPAQMRTVAATSLRAAAAVGLPEEQARLLADAIVGSLHRGAG